MGTAHAGRPAEGGSAGATGAGAKVRLDLPLCGWDDGLDSPFRMKIPGMPEAFLRGLAHERAGRYMEAVQAYHDAHDQGYEPAGDYVREVGYRLYQEAIADWRQGRHAAAVMKHEAAFVVHPELRRDAGVLYNFGTMLLEMRDYPQALVVLKETLRIDPTALVYYHQLAYSEMQLGLPRVASETIRQGFAAATSFERGTAEGTPIKDICRSDRQDFTEDLPNLYVRVAEESIETYPHRDFRVVSSAGEMRPGKVLGEQRCERFVARLDDAEIVGVESILSRGVTQRLTGFNAYDGFSELRHLTWLTSHLVAKGAATTEMDCPQGAIALASDVSSNYYHWIFDNFARLQLIELFPELAGLPLLLPRHGLPFVWEMLQMLEWPGGVLAYQAGINRFKRLYVPSRFLPGASQGTPSACTRWVRQRLGRWRSVPSDAGKRLYISRGATAGRRLVNEDALFAALQPHGFHRVSLEGLSVAEQIALFANAEIVVGPHGAGFANLIYAPEGVAVVELCSETVDFNPAYVEITHVIDGRHVLMECRGAGTVGGKPLNARGEDFVSPDWINNNIDLEVDLDLVLDVLDELKL